MPAYSHAWVVGGSVGELAGEQVDVLARAQLHALGASRFRIRDEVRAGRWRIIGAHAVVLHRGPLSETQRHWVALINAGPRSALCGPSAAAADGLVGFSPAKVHVIVPHGTHVRPLPWMRVHWSRRYDPASDRYPARTPPRTRLARSVADAAAWTATPRVACALVAAAVQQRLVPVAQIRAELERTPRSRHRRALLSVLADIEGGAGSFAEIDAGRLCRRAGLPPPTRQAIRLDSHGRRRYLDLAWPEHRLAVEIDGGFHWDANEWQGDLDRQNDLVLDGLRILRFPSALLRLNPDRFLHQLAQALAQG
jgi:Protein of unknown function (DUF559)